MLTKRKDGRYMKTKTINGIKVFFYSSETKERKAQMDIEKQMLEYSHRETVGKKLSDVCDEWERIHYEKVKVQTMERYKSYVKRFSEFFGNKYIKKITPADVERFLHSLVLDGYSTKTIKDQASIVKLIMKFAIIKGYIKKNPSQYITPPKGREKEVREALTDEDVKRIKSDTSSDFGRIAYFLLYTGLRKGEMLALTYGDIDYKGCTVCVNKSIEYLGNKPRVGTTKTKAGVRLVPLPDVLKPIVKKGKHKSTDIIFGKDGAPMPKSYFRDHWVRYCKDIGISATPHQLRHTYATMLFEWNITEKDAQTIMGHSDIAVTHNIYTHIRTAHMEDTIKNINEKICSK